MHNEGSALQHDTTTAAWSAFQPSSVDRAGGATAVVEPNWRACSEMEELSQSVCVTIFKHTYRYSHTKTDTQIITQSTRSMSCTIRSEINKPINVKYDPPHALLNNPPPPHHSPRGTKYHTTLSQKDTVRPRRALAPRPRLLTLCNMH